MLYLTWGWRYKVTGSVYPAFVSIQPQGRVLSLSLLPSTCGYQVYKILQQVRRLINLVWHPPVHLYSPSLSVMLTDFTQSYTVSHCSGLWPSAPPGRLASLPNHNLLILPELIFQKAQPILCTLPTRTSGMSVDLILWLSCTQFLFRMAHSCTSLKWYWPFNPHVWFHSQVAIVGVAICTASLLHPFKIPGVVENTIGMYLINTWGISLCLL